METGGLVRWCKGDKGITKGEVSVYMCKEEEEGKQHGESVSNCG